MPQPTEDKKQQAKQKVWLLDDTLVFLGIWMKVTKN